MAKDRTSQRVRRLEAWRKACVRHNQKGFGRANQSNNGFLANRVVSSVGCSVSVRHGWRPCSLFGAVVVESHGRLRSLCSLGLISFVPYLLSLLFSLEYLDTLFKYTCPATMLLQQSLHSMEAKEVKSVRLDSVASGLLRSPTIALHHSESGATGTCQSRRRLAHILRSPRRLQVRRPPLAG
jgi:hypothetical protein